jgi:hypothetical protein
MMACYALEHRSRWFVLAFAAPCVLASVYGFFRRAWPLGLVEAVWALVARVAGARETPPVLSRLAHFMGCPVSCASCVVSPAVRDLRYATTSLNCLSVMVSE